MRTKITLIAFVFIFYTNAQSNPSEVKGGEFVFNPEKKECLSDAQREQIFNSITSNIRHLEQQNRLTFNQQNRGTHPLFIWPLQKSASSTYNEVYGISGFLDHNSAFPNQLTDYNCGSRSYDTNSGYNHQGVDVFTWPFGWKMMDNDEVEIIAGAPGQIVGKSDGNFDRSCDFGTTTPWNSVYIQHSDGSIALYGHMKNGSTTTKNVGDMVSEGEYLGVVGSSGISTGPHLHFEIFTDATFTQLVDPYSGSCNSLNGDSWWQAQRPYNDPGINAALTHSAPPVFNPCPTTETTNESNNFDSDDTIYFALYLKDQQAGTSVNLKIRRPDNSVLYNWDFALTDTFVASYWYWFYTGVYDVDGEWKWEATYSGETVSHSFNVGTLSVDEQNLNSASLYPNPFNDIININSDIAVKEVKVVDVLGKQILNLKRASSQSVETLNLEGLTNGMYFITIVGESNQQKIFKVIKK